MALRAGLFLVLLFPLAQFEDAQIPDSSSSLAMFLEGVRAKHALPALGAAVVTGGEIKAFSCVGFRKAGSSVQVSPADQFHLGSISKSMTATMLAVMVQRRMLRWDTTIGQTFPELHSTIRPEYEKVTLLMLCSHRAGFPKASKAMSAIDWYSWRGTPTEARYKYLSLELSYPPLFSPGTKFNYAFGYEIAAAMAERVASRSYEDLMQELLFRPLRMSTAGFGPSGSKDKFDQPWPHVAKNGKYIPLEPVPRNDNSIVGEAGGEIHCSLEDFAKYLQAHAIGEYGESTLLPAESFRFLHQMHFTAEQPISGQVTDNYAVGWFLTVDNTNANGLMLWHDGTNGRNCAIAWVAPNLRKAFCAVTNAAGEGAFPACNEVVSHLVSQSSG